MVVGLGLGAEGLGEFERIVIDIERGGEMDTEREGEG